MRQTWKVLIVAFVAIFVCAESHAQFGKVIRGASKVVGSGLLDKKKKTEPENKVIKNADGTITIVDNHLKQITVADYKKRSKWNKKELITKIM